MNSTGAKFSKDNKSDMAFIERFYHDFEHGLAGVGKAYKRPADYIERALRVMNNSASRNKAHISGISKGE